MGLILLDGMRDMVAEVLMQFLEICSNLVSSVQHNRFEGNFKFGMKIFVRIERGDHGHRMRGVVVCELCKEDEVYPIILLVVDVHPKILLQDLVDPSV